VPIFIKTLIHLIQQGHYVHLLGMTIGSHYQYGYAITAYGNEVCFSSPRPEDIGDFILSRMDLWFSSNDLFWAIQNCLRDNLYIA
jgi:hypothetical protein